MIFCLRQRLVFRTLSFAIVAAVMCAWLPIRAVGQDGMLLMAAFEESLTKAIAQAEPSVVSIARIRKDLTVPRDQNGLRFPPGVNPTRDQEEFVPSEFGSGIIFEPPDQPGKRLILTMYHVVKGGHVAGKPGIGDALTIHTHQRRKARVEILAADPRSDLAVLQLKPNQSVEAKDLEPLTWCKKTDYKKGQFVITLGNPYAIARDGSATASWGMISNIARQPQPLQIPLTDREGRKEEMIHHMGTLLQIDAHLNLGTSGGAVLNRQGELVGIITAMAAIDGYEKSVGYAVPLNAGIKRIITELAHGYEVGYGLLGIEPGTRDFPADKQPTAVSVERVGSGAPAAERLSATAPEPKLQKGDLIYSVNGQTLYTRKDLMREIALIGPGEVARLQLYRGRTGQWLTRNVELTKWPVLNDEDIIATNSRYRWNEISVDYSTARFDYFNQQYRPAVLVTKLDENSAPHQAGLRVGDFITHIDGAPVTSPQKFLDVTKSKRSGTAVLQLIDRKVTVQVSAPFLPVN